eukprot:m.29964 g.29964  ORF g.29964 m.29964 type:complete len:735 (+) comp4725_c0_seq1:71-2275(+)
MTAAVFALCIIVTFFFTLHTLRKYGNPRKSYLTTTIVMVAWFFSFSITVILPMDVSATFYLDCVRDWYCHPPDNSTIPLFEAWCADIEYNQQAEEYSTALCDSNSTCSCSKPYSYINQSTLPSYWEATYWTSQALTWLLISLIESYMSAGDFTIWTKFVSAVKEYLLINSIYFVIGTSFLIYIAATNHLDMAGLKAVVIAMANMSGLVVVMVFLGHGIVALPRQWFKQFNWEGMLKAYQYRAGKLRDELTDAEEKVNGLIGKVKDLRGVIPADDPLRPYLNEIIRHCPELQDGEDYHDFTRDDDACPTLSTLAQLNKKLMRAKRIESRCRCQWGDLMDKALALEETIEVWRSGQRRFDSKYSSGASKGFLKEYKPHVKYYWKCLIQPYMYLTLAMIGTLLSLAIVWSEVTFSTFLSVYAQIIVNAGKTQEHFAVELLTFVTLLYMCMCTFRVIFKVRLLNFYYMVGKQSTDSSSLLYSATALCRTTVPLCLNYLAMVHLDNHVTDLGQVSVETSFTVVMGHMDVLSFLNSFALYYPIIIIPVSLASLFHLHARILSALGLHSAYVEDGGTNDALEEGKTLIAMEKSRRLRGDSTGPLRGEARSHDDDPPLRNTPPAARATVAPPKRTRPPSSGTARLKDYLENYNKNKSETAAAAPKPKSSSLFSWGRSSEPAEASSTAATRRAAAPVGINSLGSLRKMFGNEHEEDEEELLPTRAPPAAPPPRAARSTKNFFD